MRESKKLKLWLSNLMLSLFFRCAKSTREKQQNLAHIEFDSIIVYSTTALGDYMFNTPALRAIRQRYPHAKITLVAHPKYKSLFELRDFYDDVVFWKNKYSDMFSFVRKVRAKKPKLAVLLHSHLPYDIISAAMAGCQFIVRDNYAKPIGKLEQWLTYGLDYFDTHIIARKMKLVEALGCQINNVDMAVPCIYKKIEKAAGKIRIGFQLGASSPIRCWPTDYYANLAMQLVSRDPRVEIILIGSMQETHLSQALLSSVDESTFYQITDYVGKTTLPELLGVISSMDLLVTGDTGPFHLAIALHIPTVSLFVTANPKYTGVYQDNKIHEQIYLPVIDPNVSTECNPMSAISIDDVFKRIEKILAS